MVFPSVGVAPVVTAFATKMRMLWSYPTYPHDGRSRTQIDLDLVLEHMIDDHCKNMHSPLVIVGCRYQPPFNDNLSAM